MKQATPKFLHNIHFVVYEPFEVKHEHQIASWSVHVCLVKCCWFCHWMQWSRTFCPTDCPSLLPFSWSHSSSNNWLNNTKLHAYRLTAFYNISRRNIATLSYSDLDFILVVQIKASWYTSIVNTPFWEAYVNSEARLVQHGYFISTNFQNFKKIFVKCYQFYIVHFWHKSEQISEEWIRSVGTCPSSRILCHSKLRRPKHVIENTHNLAYVKQQTLRIVSVALMNLL